jgi:hypothetical protein
MGVFRHNRVERQLFGQERRSAIGRSVACDASPRARHHIERPFKAGFASWERDRQRNTTLPTGGLFASEV